MTINTTASSFPTLLAVFTYTGTLTSYTNLVLLACDNNAGGTGTGPSLIQFVATNGANYFVVVGGVNGAQGIAHLNYSLSPGLLPVPPVLASQPQSIVVATQTAVALSAVAHGSAPITYQWWKNSYLLRQQTNASLLLRSPQSSDSGKYTVVATNFAGAITSAPAIVSVIGAPIIRLDPASQALVSAFPCVRGYQYSVDYAGNLAPLAWVNSTNTFPDYGGVIWLTNSTKDFDSQLQRVHTP